MAVHRYFEAPESQRAAEQEVAAEYGWACAAVFKRFSAGLERLFDETFVGDRVRRFVERDDPVYATLLQGMEDEALARVLVSNWTVAHTMATMSRFWLEDAIVDIMLARPRAEGEPPPQVFSLGMLADGWHLNNRTLWDVGEK